MVSTGAQPYVTTLQSAPRQHLLQQSHCFACQRWLLCHSRQSDAAATMVTAALQTRWPVCNPSEHAEEEQGFLCKPSGRARRRTRGVGAQEEGLRRRRGFTWCAQATTSRQTPEKQKKAARSSAENRLSPKGGQPQESLCVRDMTRGSAGRTVSPNTRSVESMLEVHQAN
jgi:hypothetical protein